MSAVYDANGNDGNDAKRALLQLAEYHNMVQVKCDYCGAEPLTPCRNKINSRPTVMPHFGSRQEYGPGAKGSRERTNGIVDSMKVALSLRGPV